MIWDQGDYGTISCSRRRRFGSVRAEGNMITHNKVTIARL